MAIEFRPIGVIRSCYTGRFGIPRQPRLVTAAEARLELFPEFAREEAFAGLEGFSHIWLIFVFHDCLGAGWSPKVRPPRLGGKRRVGVFATRSPYRPNPIGISAVELIGLDHQLGRLALRLGGVDLLDGTPVLDVKPYVPYADAIPDASPGFAPEAPGRVWEVTFSDQARRQIAEADPPGKLHLPLLISQILRQDPRPGYMDRYPERREFGMRLYGLNIRWRLRDGTVEVIEVQPNDPVERPERAG